MAGYREAVKRRDRVCQVCGTSGGRGNPLTIHHKKPKCQGGKDTTENCVLWCLKCHRAYHKRNGYPTGKRRQK